MIMKQKYQKLLAFFFFSLLMTSCTDFGDDAGNVSFSLLATGFFMAIMTLVASPKVTQILNLFSGKEDAKLDNDFFVEDIAFAV